MRLAVHPLFLLAAVLAALVALGPAAGSAGAAKVTFIGDSKAAGIEFSTPAKRLLARGHQVRRDLKVCRRLVSPSCPYKGKTPRTALQAIKHYGRNLGSVLIIDVGYNDSSATYRAQMGTVVRAAKARGVKGIIWVNLKGVRQNYRRINAIINQVAKRRPIIYVANWNAYSRGKTSWFAKWDAERIHLTSAGAVGLVKLVRKYIPRAAQGPRPAQSAQVAATLALSGAGGGPASPVTGEAEGAAPPEAAPLSTGNSPPVGRNLGASGAPAGVSGLLPFAGGALLMLFLIVVTVKAHGRPSRSPAA